MIIGRLTGQFGKNRIRFNSEYQHRCEGTPLNVETEGCHNRGEDWIGLGNNAGAHPDVAGSDVDGGPRLLRRAVLRQPGHVDDAASATSCSSRPATRAFRYQPIFGHPAPDGITNLIPVHRAVERDQPGHRPAVSRRWRTTAIAACESWGWAVGKTDGWQATASYVTGAHNMKVGYQGNRLDLLDQTIANETQLGYRFNQGVPNAVSYCLPDFGRRTITSTARLLRPGQLDARPPHAAGRAALRPRVELRAGRS